MPELVPLLVGLIEVLLAAAADFVATLIGKLIPSIPIVGNALRHAIEDVWDHTVGGWLIDRAAGDTGAARTLTGVTLRTHQVIKGALAVLSHHGDQISHLDGVTIPAAVSTAHTYTDHRVGALSSTVTHDVHNINREITDTNGAVLNLTNYLNGQFLSAVESDIRTAVSLGIVAAERQANADVSNLAQQVTKALDAIWGNVAGLDTLANVTLPADITREVDAAAATQAAARAGAVAALSADISSLQGQITAAIAAGATALADGLAVQQQSLRTAVATLQGEITIDGANTRTNTRELTDVIVPGIAAVAAAVATITAEYQRCAVTTCEGPNNYRSLFNAVMGGLDTAGIVALLEGAVRDPGGEAKAFAGTLGDLYHEGHSLVDGLLSLSGL